MFRFEEPAYLYLLLVLPVLAVIRLYSNYQRRKAIERFGDPQLISNLMLNVSRFRPTVKFSLLMLAVAFFPLLIARPQFGSKLEKMKRQGVEVVIALDISNSMLAEDVQPNRLEKAKRIVAQLVDKMENDKVGMIVFAGDAFTQLPITNDYISAKMFLESINPSLIAKQGTAIGQAVALASRSFTPNEEVGKAVIVITDGENHEGGIEQAVKNATEKNIQINVLGVGLPEGAPIPIPNTNDYRKDRDGNTVVTKLNESMCQAIAKEGNGIYIRVDNTNNAQKLISREIDKMGKTDVESEIYTEFNEQFQAVAWVILILILIEMLILECKNPLFRKMELFKKLFCLMLLLSTACIVNAQKAERYNIRKGNKQYNDSAFVEAEINYRKALEVNPKSTVSKYNLGNTLLMQNKTKEAIEQYAQAAQLENNKEKLAQIYHNLGSALMMQKDYAKAVEALKQSMRNNPNDDETRYNLALAQKMLKVQQQNQQQQPNNQDQKQQENKQEEKQQQDQQQNQKQQNQQQQAQKDEMSKENAEQLLQSVMQDEKDVQEKVKRQQAIQIGRLEKDW